MTIRTARIVLVCQDPPPGEHAGSPTEFGLLDKAGVLHAGTSYAGGAQRFALAAQVKDGLGGAPDFAGPFVHGPRGGRFLYLGWRPPGGAWIRRYKILLAGMTAELLDTAGAGALEAVVSTNERRATLSIPAGWSIAG
jgi:hypothetical protein